MPEKKWFFDTVVLSNFLLVDANHILEKRYYGKGFITRAVYDEIINGIAAMPKLGAVEKLLAKKVFNIHSLSSSEHKLFLELAGHLGRGEASLWQRQKSNQLLLSPMIARPENSA